LLQPPCLANMITIMSRRLIDHFASLRSVRRTFAPGEYLFHRSDPVKQVYWVELGTAHLVRFTREGAPVIMQRASAGTLLAEASIFAERYHCDGIAAELVCAVQFARSDIVAALDSSPPAAIAFARHAAGELMLMRSRAEIASFRTVEERLDAWLALNDCELPPRGKRRGLADELGISPEALYREVARRRARDP
jgi:CRP-like cAMP-binding protein